MIKLYEAGTGIFLGTLTDAQLQFLIDQLEEESIEDTDYYINSTILDVFESVGADTSLLVLLRQALGSREEMDIQWVRE